MVTDICRVRVSCVLFSEGKHTREEGPSGEFGTYSVGDLTRG